MTRIRQHHWLISVKLEDLWVSLWPIERFDLYAVRLYLDFASALSKATFNPASTGRFFSYFILGGGESFAPPFLKTTRDITIALTPIVVSKLGFSIVKLSLLCKA